MRTRRLMGTSALGLLLLVTLTGCVKMNMDLTLNPDDTIDGTLVIAVTAEAAEAAGMSPEEIADQIAEGLARSDPEDTRTEAYEEGEYIGTTTYFEKMDLADLSGTTGTDDLRIAREDDEFVVTGAVDMSRFDAEAMTITTEPDIRIAITFPGEVSSHDGTLDGTTVVWTPVAGERTELNARGSAVASSGLSPIVMGLIGLFLVITVAVVAFLLVRSRKASAAPAGAAPAYDPAYGQPTTGYGTPQPGVDPYLAGPPDPQAAPPAPEYGSPAPQAAPPAPPVEPPAPPAPPTREF